MSASVFEALAEVFEQSARTLRVRAAQLRSETEEPTESSTDAESAVARFRVLHPQAGPRQVEVVQVLEEAGPAGTNTGVISRRINYDQPNVYLTLQGLITRGFVVKDSSTSPHNYRLSQDLS